MPILIKGLLSATIIVALSELAKRHVLLSGLLAAMPFTTLLVILWVYFDSSLKKFPSFHNPFPSIHGYLHLSTG